MKKIWKMRKKSKMNSEMIGKIWKKGKLNSEKNWKIQKKLVKKQEKGGWEEGEGGREVEEVGGGREEVSLGEIRKITAYPKTPQVKTVIECYTI